MTIDTKTPTLRKEHQYSLSSVSFITLNYHVKLQNYTSTMGLFSHLLVVKISVDKL